MWAVLQPARKARLHWVLPGGWRDLGCCSVSKQGPSSQVSAVSFHMKSCPLLTSYGLLGFPGGSCGKAPTCHFRRRKRQGFNPESGRSTGGGHSKPLQYLTWRIPWTEKPGELRSIGSQRVRHDWSGLPSIRLRTEQVLLSFCFILKTTLGSRFFWLLLCLKEQSQKGMPQFVQVYPVQLGWDSNPGIGLHYHIPF